MTSIQTSPGQEGQSPLRAQLQELIGSMRVAQLLSVAATLGIADQLTEGPKRLDELSAMIWYRAVLDGGWRTMRSSAAALKNPGCHGLSVRPSPQGGGVRCRRELIRSE